jgi:hypothetical protein
VDEPPVLNESEEISAEAVRSFAARLETYSETLTEREQQALSSMLIRAMEPIDRIRWAGGPMRLAPEEEAFLQRLDDEASRTEP